MAKIEAERVNAAMDTPTMAGRLKRSRSSMGSSRRHSAIRKIAIRTAEPTSRLTMVGLLHPFSLPCTRANTSRNSETEKKRKPIQSMRRGVGSFESWTLARVRATATTPIGMLTKKIHRQPMPLVMAPPRRGPMATAPPTTAP